MNNTKIYTADVTLNRGSNSQPMIVIENQNGILLVDENLFVLSLDKNDDIEIIVKEHLK